ncbi:hypothetical protein LF1_56350 [Rubripirellula obstinata]|uniref:Uncharacterized protein n=1 Tax=Rubripirellula obstinata TaxID=406547 RepID=A0A5B1CCF4_9BACT|nr:hypothetical protein [Rubripirellula obstinata]KAA1257073.1 hypothetical protein LF1_56350 [Rubripirellula obstinata]
MGAERARRTAALLDDFLAASPPLDTETLNLVAAYAETERKLHAQFQAAVDDGRADLTGDELEVSQDCSLAGMTLQQELCQRIDFDALVTVYP